MQIAEPHELIRQARGQLPLAAIAASAESDGGDVYLVGGAVRDLILGRGFIDIDLAVDGDPSRLAAELGADSVSATRFGTLGVQRDGYRFDLARTRSERYLRPGALPDVEPAGIDADLARRDFTLNALALGLSGRRAGELLAAPGALEDIAAGRLAVLHDRSFIDDPTRLFRLARYAARLAFTIVPHTRRLAANAIANDALATISGTRIGNELRLLATEPDPVTAFQAVAALGLPWTIDAQAARGALEVLPADGRRDLLVLGCVLRPDELEDLGFTATDRATVAEVAGAGDLARRLAATHTRSEIGRTVGTAGIETVALAFSQGSPSPSLTWLRELRHLRLQITGSDLISCGVPEGPAIGQALAKARSALLDGTAPDRESQLAIALAAGE